MLRRFRAVSQNVDFGPVGHVAGTWGTRVFVRLSEGKTQNRADGVPRFDGLLEPFDRLELFWSKRTLILDHARRADIGSIRFAPKREEMAALLTESTQSGDMILLLGAGDIGEFARTISARCGSVEPR
jgi:hypothetical protein